MKGRIIRDLHALSERKEKNDYLDEFCKACDTTPGEVSAKASQILTSILNDYSRFSVGTIDKFFQFIIRTFAREAGLQASYNLELNNRIILNEATDNLLFEMDKDESLRDWLIQYAENLMLDGKAINLKKEIITLGGEIFKENFNSLKSFYGNEVINDQKIREFSKITEKKIHEFERWMKETGLKFLSSVKNNNLELNDFKGGQNGFVHYFEKIACPWKVKTYEFTKTAKEAIDNPFSWYKDKSVQKDAIIHAYSSLNNILKETREYLDRNFMEYETACSICRNLYAFGILNSLSVQVRQIVADRNLFLLSDSSQFLNEIIGDNDTPFIYEKAGIFYKHFMLDELPDT